VKFGIKKLEFWGYHMVKKSWRLRFDTIPARDRQTDGRTDGHVTLAKSKANWNWL